MHIEFLIIITLIVIYYYLNRSRILSIDKLSEPIFIINISYILNFPLRAGALILLSNYIESAPNFVMDYDVFIMSLLYSFVCQLVFNYSYLYFMNRNNRHVPKNDISGSTIQPVPSKLYCFYFALALIVAYYMTMSISNKTLNVVQGEADIPQIVRAIQYSLDFTILASLLLYLATKKYVYIIIFTGMSMCLMYQAFAISAKYPLFVYLILIGIIFQRNGTVIKNRHIIISFAIVVPYFIFSYMTRAYDLDIISHDVSLTNRISSISEFTKRFSYGEIFRDFFLLKFTDRFVYLEALMIYIRKINSGIELDLYDRFGSIPTFIIALPSFLGIDKNSLPNIHMWFGDKYWHGKYASFENVIIPFGRITESFVVLRYFGFVMFIFYGYLFSYIYNKFYKSHDQMMNLYYYILYFHYIVTDDVLFYNIAFLVHSSIIYFMVIFAYSLLHKKALIARS